MRIFLKNSSNLLAGKWWGDCILMVLKAVRQTGQERDHSGGIPAGLSLSVSAQSDAGDYGFTRGRAGGSVSLSLLAELH